MTWKTMEKVLIVGAGLTGATSASLLRERFPSLGIAIWDKANGVGGRMSTSRSPNDSKCTVDMGLQYVSVSPFYRQKHSSIYEELLSTGLLSPLTTPIEGDRNTDCIHYVTPQGSSSIVKHFIKKSGVEVKRSHHVSSVDIDKGENPGLTVTTQSGVTARFDAVLLTLPVPQILQIKGSLGTIIDSLPERKEKLQAVKYSSRFCLGLFYKAGVSFDVPWSAKYIPGHPCLRYVCIDSQKRGSQGDSAPSVVVHTSVPYGIENLERDKEQVKPEIYQHFQKMFPDLPQPDFIKGHKWRYSQVSESYESSPGCLILKDDPFVICGGDGFTHSKFDGCLDAAQAIAKAFQERITNSNNDS